MKSIEDVQVIQIMQVMVHTGHVSIVRCACYAGDAGYDDFG